MADRKKRTCIAADCCVTSKTHPDYSFFSVPLKKDRRLQWLKLVGREDLLNRSPQNLYLCETHFQENSIMCTSFRRFLQKDTLPIKSQSQKSEQNNEGIKLLPISSPTTSKENPDYNMMIFECDDTVKIEDDEEYTVVVKLESEDEDDDMSSTLPSVEDMKMVEQVVEDHMISPLPSVDAMNVKEEVEEDHMNSSLPSVEATKMGEKVEQDPTYPYAIAKKAPAKHSKRSEIDNMTMAEYLNIDENNQVLVTEFSKDSAKTNEARERFIGESRNADDGDNKIDSEGYRNEFYRTMFSAQAPAAVINKVLRADLSPNDTMNTALDDNMVKFIFKGKREMLLPANFQSIFGLFIKESFLKVVAFETNKHALYGEQNEMDAKEIKPDWIDTNVQELKVFLGLLIHMGTYRMHKIPDYWEINERICTRFADYMSLNRFMQILNNLTFTSEKNEADSLWEIRPIINYFNNIMKGTYSPDKVLVVDESEWPDHDDDFFLRNVSEKEPSTSSTRLYMLREPSGVILKFDIHNPTADVGKSTADRIFKMAEDRLDIGHSLFLQSSQTSFELANKLLARSTYCTGTLSEPDCAIPRWLANYHLPVYGHKSVFKDNIRIGKWKMSHNKEVFYITTEHPDKIMKVQQRSGFQLYCPLVFLEMDNCHHEAGIKHLYASYPLRNTELPDHIKIFIHILMLSLSNAHILFTKYVVPLMSFYEFRLKFIENLLPASNKLPIPHRLELLPMSKEHKIARVCRNCVKESKLGKLTNYVCKDCLDSPPMCVECFCDIHC